MSLTPIELKETINWLKGLINPETELRVNFISEYLEKELKRAIKNEVTPNHHAPWSEKEDQLLVLKFKNIHIDHRNVRPSDNALIREVSEEFGRTTKAIWSRLKMHGITSDLPAFLWSNSENHKKQT